jgi:hypothetical protein
MALKKRITNFVSNWLGVIIAVVIVAVSATFGGVYLYGRNRLDNTLGVVTQFVTLPYKTGFVFTGTADNPNTYHITLRDDNVYSDTVEVTISDITVSLDGYDFPLIQDGDWTKTLPNGFVTFEGDITIDKDALTALVAEGQFDLSIRGNISASGHYLWIKRQMSRPIAISVPDLHF